MQRISFAVVLAAFLAISVAAGSQQPYGATPAGQKGHVTITGCVVKGDGGYLLTNVADREGRDANASGAVPSSSGIAAARTPTLGEVLYWLDDEDKLQGHEGQRVEVKGELEGDVKKGEMEIKRKDGKVEIEAKAGGKKVKAILPDTSPAIGTAGAPGDKKVELEYLLRRFDVDSVKMITSTCQ
jgi:hypothetical protein